ncbi:hypothetical protein D3228_11815 [Leucobacter luti]|nr:hypothetical protein [Leucobacter luti]
MLARIGAGLAGGALGGAALVGCAPQPAPTADPALAFASTSATVLVSPDESFTMNLVLVADSESTLFDRFVDASIPGIPEAAIGTVTLVRGDTRGRHAIANLQVEVTPGSTPLVADTVTLTLVDGAEFDYPIGEWRMSEATGTGIEPSSDWPALMTECSSIVGDIENTSAAPLSDVTLRTDAGVSAVTPVGFILDVGAVREVELKLDCAPDFDMYVRTIAFDYAQQDGSTATSPVQTVQVGYADISDEDVARIAERAPQRSMQR